MIKYIDENKIRANTYLECRASFVCAKPSRYVLPEAVGFGDVVMSFRGSEGKLVAVCKDQ